MATSSPVSVCPGQLPMAQGFIDIMDPQGEYLSVAGWMLSPDQPVDGVQVYLDDQPLPTPESMARPDLKAMFPDVAHAESSGFHVQVPRAQVGMTSTNLLRLMGTRDNRPVLQMMTALSADPSALPTPPAALIRRVCGTEDAGAFRLSGLRHFGEIYAALSRHVDPDAVRHLLDWGCGCGRLSNHFLTAFPDAAVSGCDIDGEAVEWCRDRLPRGRFDPIPTMPPTAYPSNSFDVVVGYSVFTHLAEPVQQAWLNEIHRMLGSGGWLVTSVHGPAAAADKLGVAAGEKLRRGIYDQLMDGALGDVAPRGYYRAVFQTPEYVRKAWSRDFEVIEHIERGLGGFQDLLVLRAK